ncbi:RNA polymerase II elongation factor ELL2 [Protopterus annectens]|uniref:RNA polymerase II elongation factor ELL2 n=1 Tax=Protopterus annectens TaxID=7888 RepID=UPI001CFA7C66|nr:RNA polymerase II elongation factor ELL2 [Protopterus annectens]
MSAKCIRIPRNNSSELHTFNFYVSNVGKDNPQGSFDCIQQCVSSSGESQLDCLGVVQNKVTVCATNDSYQMTRERMTQAEEETRSRSTKVIKPGGPFVGKRVQIRKPVQAIPDTIPERKRSTPLNPASTIRKCNPNSSVAQRPYRDRVIHLLVLKPYKKPELLARLQRDGVNQKDKNSLGVVLQQVANLNPKDNSYVLKDSLHKEVQKDWPGYLEGDKQLLEQILARKVNQPQNSTSISHPLESQPSSPVKDTASASPPQKRMVDSDFIDPLVHKKPRISHLTNRVQPTLNGHLTSCSEKIATAATSSLPPHPPPAHLPVCNPSHAVNSNSNSPSTPEGGGTQDLPTDSFSQNCSSCGDQQKKYASRTPIESSPLPPAPLECSKTVDVEISSHKKSKKSKKHKDKDKEQEKETKHITEKKEEPKEKCSLQEKVQITKVKNMSSPCKGEKETCPDSSDPPATEVPDYFV